MATNLPDIIVTNIKRTHHSQNEFENIREYMRMYENIKEYMRMHENILKASKVIFNSIYTSPPALQAVTRLLLKKLMNTNHNNFFVSI